MKTADKLKNMTFEQMSDALTDIINARESYPENSLNKKAIALDDDYQTVDNFLQEFRTFRSRFASFVMDDTVRKENFTDVEICCEDDNYLANDILDDLLDEITWNGMIEFILEEGYTVEEVNNQFAA